MYTCQRQAQPTLWDPSQGLKAYRRASSVLAKDQWWPEHNLQLFSHCSPAARNGPCADQPHAWPSQAQLVASAGGLCSTLWHRAVVEIPHHGTSCALPGAETAQPAPYLVQCKGADGVGRQLDCVQQGHLDHPVGFRTPAWPVLVTLYLQGGEEKGSVLGCWLGHSG